MSLLILFQMNIRRISNPPVFMHNELEDELDLIMHAMEIPDGIAETQSLRENIYSLAVCCDCGIPLIIIGPPGTSKSLAVSIVKNSMKGDRSASVYLRDMVNIHDDMLFYQCSETSTSKEVEDVFDSAIARQRGYESLGSSHRVTVFLDEAGIPNRRREALKVLIEKYSSPFLIFWRYDGDFEYDLWAKLSFFSLFTYYLFFLPRNLYILLHAVLCLSFLSL